MKNEIMLKYVFVVSIVLFNSNLTFSQNNMLMIKKSGKVVIGDTTAINTIGDYNLYVQNGILTERVKVALHNQSEWKDDAFNHTPSISDVDESIKTKKHLYNMPSAKQLVEDGYELKEMDAKLLEQIEWLWQYVIELKNENTMLKEKLNSN